LNCNYGRQLSSYIGGDYNLLHNHTAKSKTKTSYTKNYQKGEISNVAKGNDKGICRKGLSYQRV
jgi:hypothetical protein